MSEQIDLLAAIKQQQVLLKRLLEKKIWVSNAPKATVEEMKGQISQIKSLIQELEELIQAKPH